MVAYRTVTVENDSTTTMGAGTELNRLLCSIGAGFTLTGIELTLFMGFQATAVATGITTGVAATPQKLVFGLSMGNSGYTPASILTNPDSVSFLWWSPGEEEVIQTVAPASTSWQGQFDYRRHWARRYQFRLANTTDFKFQVGNNNPASSPIRFVASMRATFA